MADKGCALSNGVRVTTDSVLQAARPMGDRQWTVLQLAELMGAPVTSVRIAVSRLVIRNAVEHCGDSLGHYRHGNRMKSYKIGAYRIRTVGEVDFNTLYRAFGYGR